MGNYEAKRPSVAEEVISTGFRYRESRRQKKGQNGEGIDVAQTCLALLRQDDAFVGITDEPIPENEELVEIGRGWNGVAYRIGNAVLKINHKRGPVVGFEYPQTSEGATLAQRHYEALSEEANRAGLPFLIPKSKVEFVPINENEGRVVTIQKFYDNLFDLRQIRAGAFSLGELQQIQKEVEKFFRMCISLYKTNKLLPDVFGKNNLAVTREANGRVHLILCDIGPVDTTIAGKIAQVGMETWLAKRAVEWTWVLEREKIKTKNLRRKPI